jgi:adenine-specific DNA-methyltransferase
MNHKQKLELTWIGKEKRPRLEARILLEDAGRSYHAGWRMSDSDIFDNRLIFGDNLLALKALEQGYTGRVKCVFIDPPYNTGSAFTHYDDGLEHSIWLGLMRDRLEIIRRLLAEDGSLWITIDDNEAHYLKVLCDEVFGRGNFVANVIWQKKYAPANDAIWLSDSHDHVLVYAKNKILWRPELLSRTEKVDLAYKNPDNDPRGAWKSGDYTCNKNADERPNLYYPITNPHTGDEVWPKRTAVWRFNPEAHKVNVEKNLVWWGKDGTNSVPAFKRLLDSVKKDGIVPQTIWLWEDVGHTQDGKKEQIRLIPDDPFGTPKPEKLLNRILHIATNPCDLVLDSFAGSGTTGAVAHKMGRRWIMVELGEHCHTHIIPRLQKVIDGEDKGGVTESVGWQGGGGFRYYRLAPSLIVNDRWGNPIINPEYNAAQLAEALCKLEGFTYAPSEIQWWRHGHSSERDFIYVTTQNLSIEQLQALADEIALSPDPSPASGRGEHRSLLICCAAFRGITAARAAERWTNLTLKKIPKMVLSRCEWGHDDYSLNVANLPMAVPSPPTPLPPAGEGRKARAADTHTADLFGKTEGDEA